MNTTWCIFCDRRKWREPPHWQDWIRNDYENDMSLRHFPYKRDTVGSHHHLQQPRKSSDLRPSVREKTVDAVQIDTPTQHHISPISPSLPPLIGSDIASRCTTLLHCSQKDDHPPTNWVTTNSTTLTIEQPNQALSSFLFAFVRRHDRNLKIIGSSFALKPLISYFFN